MLVASAAGPTVSSAVALLTVHRRAGFTPGAFATWPHHADTRHNYLTNLRGIPASRNPDLPRLASSLPPPVGALATVVDVDELTGRARYRSGYRVVATVETAADGRPVVAVATDTQWDAWTRDGQGDLPAQRWPAELVWWSEDGHPW